MLNQKFLIVGGELCIGRVDYHKDLIMDPSDEVAGGGWWHLDKESKVMILYSNSHDYGQACKEAVIEAIMCTKDKYAKEYFITMSTTLEEALIQFKTMKESANGYISDKTLLPSHYGMPLSQPHFEGKGNHSVAQLEELCEQYKDYVHQQQVIKQHLISFIVNTK